MIISKSLPGEYLTEISDGTRSAEVDAPVEKGGGGKGFSPFALLEASLCSCINITLRHYAKSHDIPLERVETTVTLMSDKDGAAFECVAKLPKGLTEEQQKRLRGAMKGCPIHALLTKPVTFEMKSE